MEPRAVGEHPSIAIILQEKKNGIRPSWQEIASREASTKIYWSYWDSLELRNDILYKRWEVPNLKDSVAQLVVPKSRIQQILKQAHDSPSREHFGINKTLEKIRKRFYGRSINRTSKISVGRNICVARCSPTRKGKSSLQIYNVESPFEKVQMNVLDSLPITLSGNRYLLVVVDCFIKWVEAFPLKNIRAKTLSQKLS